MRSAVIILLVFAALVAVLAGREKYTRARYATSPGAAYCVDNGILLMGPRRLTTQCP